MAKIKLSETRLGEIDEKDVIRGFIATAELGLCNKDEIQEKYNLVVNKIDDLNSRIGELEAAAQRWEHIDESADSKEAYTLAEEYGTQEDVLARYEALDKERTQWAHYLTQLEALLGEYKNFNKTLCFSNIRELLRQHPEVKIGQIEKEAGIRLGYMSRLEKEGNTAEPSMEFIVTAAKLLKVRGY